MSCIDTETEIRALLEGWARAVEERDLDRIVADHAEDILMFDVPTIQLEGKAAYRASWQEMFPWLGEAGRFALDDLRVHAGQDIAYATAILRCSGTELRRSGKELTIRLTVGLRRDEDGWVVAHEHHSEASPS